MAGMDVGLHEWVAGYTPLLTAVVHHHLAKVDLSLSLGVSGSTIASSPTSGRDINITDPGRVEDWQVRPPSAEDRRWLASCLKEKHPEYAWRIEVWLSLWRDRMQRGQALSLLLDGSGPRVHLHQRIPESTRRMHDTSELHSPPTSDERLAA